MIRQAALVAIALLAGLCAIGTAWAEGSRPASPRKDASSVFAFIFGIAAIIAAFIAGGL